MSRLLQAMFNVPLREVTLRSPFGRTLRLRVDDAGRPLRVELPGLEPLDVSYSGGLLACVAQGSRAHTFAYDARRRLQSVTAPPARGMTFTYDDADQVLSEITSDGRRSAPGAFS